MSSSDVLWPKKKTAIVTEIKIKPIATVETNLRVLVKVLSSYHILLPHSGQNFGAPLICAWQLVHFLIKDWPHSGQNFTFLSASNAPQLGHGLGKSLPQTWQAVAPALISAPQKAQE